MNTWSWNSVRLEHRLTVERTIAPEALRAQVPPMIVQTLVENAIKHGIAELAGGGVVRIEVAASAGQLEIVVGNTGRLKPPDPAGGYGLDNLKERLRLIYGQAASFSISERGALVEARLILPTERA